MACPQTNETNDWELSKENVRPLRQGRQLACLTAALQPETNLRQQKQEFEAELRTYNGDDPLDVWHRYIEWIEQNYPKGGKESNLTDLLDRCLRTFNGNPRYKNDERFVTVWIKYADICKEPLEIFSFLHDQGVGDSLACFYEAWAWAYEQMGNTKRADLIFQEAIKCNAYPVDLLKRRHDEFQKRITRGTMRGTIESEVADPMDEQRAVLGHLRPQGRQNKAPVQRVGHAKMSSRGGMTVQGVAPQVLGQNFQVFNDENRAPGLPPQAGEWTEMPSESKIRKENTQKPGVWTKAKMPQRTVPTHAVSKPAFTIHVEEDADQSMVTPRKQPELGNPVLSARKPDKTVDPLLNMRPTEEDVAVRIMYCKDKIQCGLEEYSFEELRAARWKAKRKLEEEKREKQEREAYLEEMRRNREMLKEEVERYKQAQGQLRENYNVMMRECRQQMLLQQEQFNSQRQMQLRLEHDSLEQDIQQRMSTQHQITADQQDQGARRRDMGVRNQLAFRDGTDVRDTSTRACRNDLRGLDTSQNTSTDILRGNTSDLAEELGVRPLTSGHVTGSGGGDVSMVHNLSQHTPQNMAPPNDSQSSLRQLSGGRPTPNCRQSLAAPSPTVNTREAMQVVRGFFNASLNIDKDWEEDLPARCENITMRDSRVECEPARASGDVMFSIYDETLEPENPRAPGTESMVKHSDKENRVGLQSRTVPRQNLHVETLAPALLTNKAEFSVFQDGDNPMEGIESQAMDDFTIAPVGSHHSFAAAAHIASTPFTTNASQRKQEEATFTTDLSHSVKDISRDAGQNVFSAISHPHPGQNIFSDPGQNMFSAVSHPDPVQNIFSTVSHPDPGENSSVSASLCNTQENIPITASNLSPIMEGSNEESSGHQTGISLGADSMLGKRHTRAVPTQDNADQSLHLIDMSGYNAQELDEKTEAILSMSIHIDPHNPFDQEAIDEFLRMLPRPLRAYPGYVACDEAMDEVCPDMLCSLGGDMYTVDRLVGKGGYASVFKVTDMDLNVMTMVLTSKQEKFYALKVQKPANPWEFYICSELQVRLRTLQEPVDVSTAMMSISRGYFYQDASCLLSDFCKFGTLLNLANVLRKKPELVCESVMMYFAIELLHMIEKLHKCQFIHGDIKPDNFLVQELVGLPDSSDPDVVFGGGKRAFQLIDFGQSIDMTKYPPQTTFVAQVKTSGFQCIEMKTKRPWTYQTDLFGLVGTIHVLVFGQYMKVFNSKIGWKMTHKVNRSWFSLWNDMFDVMLNIPSCDELPNLAYFRRQFETYFVKNLLHDYNSKQSAISILVIKNTP